MVTFALTVPLPGLPALRELRGLAEDVERFGSPFDDRDLELLEDRLEFPDLPSRPREGHERYILTGRQLVPLERVTGKAGRG